MATGFVFRDKERYVVVDRDAPNRLLYETDLSLTIPTPNHAGAISREFRSVSAGKVILRVKILGAVGGIEYSINDDTVLGAFSNQGGGIAYFTARIDANSGYNTIYIWSTSEVSTLFEIEVVSLEGLSTTEITPPQNANGLLDLKTYPIAGVSPDGLYLNDQKIGFWDLSKNAYSAYMTNAGLFELGNHLTDLNWMYWDGSVLDIGGKISAREGDIAGWAITSDWISKNRVFLDSVFKGLRIEDTAQVDNSVEIGDIALKDLALPPTNLLAALNPSFETDLTDWEANELEEETNYTMVLEITSSYAYAGSKSFSVKLSVPVGADVASY